MKFSIKQKSIYFTIVFLITLICIRFFTIHWFEVGVRDLQNLWMAACLLNNPYHEVCLLSDSQVREGVAVLHSYPPWSLLFIKYFGIVSLSDLKEIWLIVSQVGFAICAGLIFLLSCSEPKIRYCIWPILGSALSYPIYNHLTIGQLTVVQLLAFLLFLVTFKKNLFLLAGILLSISAIKPQTLWLFYLIFFLRLDPGRLRVLVGFASSIFLLTIVGVLLRLEYSSELWPVRMDNITPVIQPNLGSYLQFLLGPPGRFLPALLITICLLFLRAPKDVFTSPNLMRIIGLSILGSPYIGIHDMVFYSIPFLGLMNQIIAEFSAKEILFCSVKACAFFVSLLFVIQKMSHSLHIGDFIFYAFSLHLMYELIYLEYKKKYQSTCPT